MDNIQKIAVIICFLSNIRQVAVRLFVDIWVWYGNDEPHQDHNHDQLAKF